MNEIGIAFTIEMIRALENTRADGTAIDPHLPIKTMTRRTHKRLRRKGPRMRSAPTRTHCKAWCGAWGDENRAALIEACENGSIAGAYFDLAFYTGSREYFATEKQVEMQQLGF